MGIKKKCIPRMSKIKCQKRRNDGLFVDLCFIRLGDYSNYLGDLRYQTFFFQQWIKNLRASGYHVDMHDGLLNCFLTFEKFESETFIEAISRKKYANPCRPFIKPTAPSTTTSTTTQPSMFMWSGWSEWERSREKKKTHIRQRFCMNGRNFVEIGKVRNSLQMFQDEVNSSIPEIMRDEIGFWIHEWGGDWIGDKVQYFNVCSDYITNFQWLKLLPNFSFEVYLEYL